MKQLNVPRATLGPEEPHAASTTWPDGVLEKQGLDLYDPELERSEFERFLSSELPSHPKLHRGQLRNGLRYLILPNKVPPSRYIFSGMVYDDLMMHKSNTVLSREQIVYLVIQEMRHCHINKNCSSEVWLVSLIFSNGEVSKSEVLVVSLR